mmetsp:Transcript_24819/g.70173  ORF Transcript_24819/g.70173 Transcript_24819/m.70173 type:complete len:91 (+) Transcript_24819:36-308(+)
MSSFRPSGEPSSRQHHHLAQQPTNGSLAGVPRSSPFYPESMRRAASVNELSSSLLGSLPHHNSHTTFNYFLHSTQEEEVGSEEGESGIFY